MMVHNKPGIILSFDDTSILQWHSLLPLFKKFNLYATFYISEMESLDAEQWNCLFELQETGHVIGHHGFRHRRAGEVDVFRDPKNKRKMERLRDEPVFKTWDEFFETDIDPGIELFKKHGLRCYHYSYPFGNRTEKSDKMLLTRFKTLRRGGRGLYTPNKVPRIYSAYNFGKHPNRTTCGHEKLLNMAGDQKKVVCFYMHEPVMSRLEYIVRIAQKYHFEFYTADDIVEKDMVESDIVERETSDG